jgi:hypothetical protein
MLKRVNPGSLVPRFYGVAWRDYPSDQYVCLPVPVHVVAAAGRAMWHGLRHAHVAVMGSPRAAFAQGREYERARLGLGDIGDGKMGRENFAWRVVEVASEHPDVGPGDESAIHISPFNLRTAVLSAISPEGTARRANEDKPR